MPIFFHILLFFSFARPLSTHHTDAAVHILGDDTLVGSLPLLRDSIIVDSNTRTYSSKNVQNPVPGSLTIFTVSRVCDLQYNKTWCLVAKLVFLPFQSKGFENFSLSLACVLDNSNFLRLKSGDPFVQEILSTKRRVTFFFVDVISVSLFDQGHIPQSSHPYSICTMTSWYRHSSLKI